MIARQHILWCDGSAGFLVGVLVLALQGWLVTWYGLPEEIIWLIGGANTAYGTYALTLAARAHRTKRSVISLIIANAMWVPVCVILAVLYRASITPLGLVHLLGEGAFVGALACVEWRWRALLYDA